MWEEGKRRHNPVCNEARECRKMDQGWGRSKVAGRGVKEEFRRRRRRTRRGAAASWERVARDQNQNGERKQGKSVFLREGRKKKKSCSCEMKREKAGRD